MSAIFPFTRVEFYGFIYVTIDLKRKLEIVEITVISIQPVLFRNKIYLLYTYWEILTKKLCRKFSNAN